VTIETSGSSASELMFAGSRVLAATMNISLKPRLGEEPFGRVMKLAYSTLKFGAIAGGCPHQAPKLALRPEETFVSQRLALP
jgi:hypothetical protein